MIPVASCSLRQVHPSGPRGSWGRTLICDCRFPSGEVCFPRLHRPAARPGLWGRGALCPQDSMLPPAPSEPPSKPRGKETSRSAAGVTWLRVSFHDENATMSPRQRQLAAPPGNILLPHTASHSRATDKPHSPGARWLSPPPWMRHLEEGDAWEVGRACRGPTGRGSIFAEAWGPEGA